MLFCSVPSKSETEQWTGGLAYPPSKNTPSGSYSLIYTRGSFGSPFFFLIAMMNTTVPTETELSSVNSILMAIGQAPITRIYHKDSEDQLSYVNPEVAFCSFVVEEVNIDVQNEGGYGTVRTTTH